jgi:hypothetical protein
MSALSACQRGGRRFATGRILKELRVLNGDIDPEFAQAAVAAVTQWTYRPALLNGVPFEVTTTIGVEFRLSN